MKWPVITFFFFLLGMNISIAQSANDSPKKLIGVFDGRTPCNVLAAYLDEPVSDACIKIKWRLTLFSDSMSNVPTQYELIGFKYKKGDPRKGKLKILKGTYADPDAIVYQLNETGREPLLFQKMDDHILFFLDKDKKLLVGNRDFSYTLNRVPVE